MNVRTFAFLATFTACMIAAPLASANQIQFTAEGVINSTNMSAFQFGQSITITFVYESDGGPQLILNNTAFYNDHLSYLSVTSGGYSSSYSTGTFGQINKQNNLLNFLDGIGFQFAASSDTYSFTHPHAVSLAGVNSNSMNQTFADLQLSLQATPPTVWNDYVLPTSYDLTQFPTNQVIQMHFSNGGFQAGFTHLVIQDVTNGPSAPEPGTLLLLPPAIALLVSFRKAVLRRQ